ncbi:superoxide dismutase [Flavobacterium restrictum]|uniref:Superoxide dismutase n=1 Tax=Flavobacterium restrictum TaxID=2594428 RepID=A0A553DS35_9FLAO|nr:superoxide dismutase [Flavobacterium restrictum]TRX35588.1 superoxide dismutase [Flavobacterium restrictum]
MKKIVFLAFNSIFLLLFISCNDKKYTEVVEVPLPTVEQKVDLGVPDDVKAIDGAFQIEKLPYTYDALAPNLSAVALEMHYSKHYLTYTNNLNKALAGTPLENLTIEEVLAKLDLNNTELRNNAGGYYNHSLFWKSMAPKSGGEPKDTLAAAITKDFGSYTNFETVFKDEASKQFGSGWIWLVVDKSGKLQVTNTANQDNPLMRNALIPGTPILALDVWEHAYYLDYQYKRKNYIDAFFTVINWKVVGENYEATLKK